MFVGGEFYYDESWLLDSPALDVQGSTFLNGGTACLLVIADYLLDHGIRRVLLPSYLCPSIVTTFEYRGLDCGFYLVNEDLSLDLQDAARKAESCRAFLYINYFGFSHSPEASAFFAQLRAGGTLVIEDNAQAGFTRQPGGDFTLNSLRKFAPCDGAFLTTRLDMRPYLARYAPGPDSQRLPAIRAYRQRLGAYLLRGEGSHSPLAALFQRAEKAYENDYIVEGDPLERAAIERMDWTRIRRVRRENYTCLLDLLRTVPNATPIFPAPPDDGMALGLPVYLEGVSRSRVLRLLARAQIGALAHWDELRSHPCTRDRCGRLAAEMARNMLTLPIDQRAGRKEMEYLALQLVRAIETAKEH
jgi:hypothetical protein